MRMILRATVSLAVTMVILAFALFLPAGDIGWIKGWVFLAVFLALMIVSSVYLWRTNPELLVARSKIHRGTKRWDKVVFFFLELSFISICWLAGFDGGRLRWSAVPLWLTCVGYVLSSVGLAVIVWAMSVNKFAEMTVRIQTDRGQTVVDTGPYAIVRHPFYIGAFFWLGGIPLSLGSYWAFIPAAITVLVIVVRTALEDRTLQSELPGYKEYAARVRYRLIPGVW
jgi:protein-S-isoprenylcysteine O-methyltransferase Ste14